MTIPDALSEAVARELEPLSARDLAAAAQEITARYRQPSRGWRLTTDAHRLAYLITRLPATYAAVFKVLQELHARAPQVMPRSVLDVGAGPGTASWAAAEYFPSVERLTAVEGDAAFLSLGRRLAAGAPSPLAQATWHPHNMTTLTPMPQHDLVVLSYSLGELDPAGVAHVLNRCWEATAQALVIVEPGTPKGFETILAARDIVQGLGGTVIAPCPHGDACPKRASADWCHFSCRLARTPAHRDAKNGILSYEDEKYAYVILTRQQGERARLRVMHEPKKRSGHIHLDLCTPQGIEKSVVTKKQRDDYDWARRADWGDGRS